MLLSNLKDGIVRRHPGTPGIPALTEVTASRNESKNAIKGVAAQSIFTPFNSPFFHLCSAFAVYGQRGVGDCVHIVCACVFVFASWCACGAQR